MKGPSIASSSLMRKVRRLRKHHNRTALNGTLRATYIKDFSKNISLLFSS
jgi:hypothetical protein